LFFLNCGEKRNVDRVSFERSYLSIPTNIPHDFTIYHWIRYFVLKTGDKISPKRTEKKMGAQV
jgi:hypothetical protein